MEPRGGFMRYLSGWSDARVVAELRPVYATLTPQRVRHLRYAQIGPSRTCSSN